VTTTVTRSWEGSDAWLELTGTWPRGSEARRLAMLAVYQVGTVSIEPYRRRWPGSQSRGHVMDT
jgi:hypothetical protein